MTHPHARRILAALALAVVLYGFCDVIVRAHA